MTWNASLVLHLERYVTHDHPLVSSLCTPDLIVSFLLILYTCVASLHAHVRM